MNYDEAVRLLTRGNDRLLPVYGLAWGVALQRDGEAAVLWAHGLPVLRFLPDRAVVTTHGSRDPDVKSALGTYLPAGLRVVQREGAWRLMQGVGHWMQYVAGPNPGLTPVRQERAVTSDVPLHDGMALAYDGTILHDPGDPAQTAADLAHNRRVSRKITAYVKGLTGEIVAGQVRLASQGSCPLCQYEPVAGTTFGDALGDTGHLEKHMADRLYPYHLLFNALMEGWRGSRPSKDEWCRRNAERSLRDISAVPPPHGEDSDLRSLQVELGDYLRCRLYRGEVVQTQGRPAPIPDLGRAATADQTAAEEDA